MNKAVDKSVELPDNLHGRNLHEKVIPTVCNLEKMLEKLIEVEGDYSQLEQWEQRSYNAYQIDDIKDEILNSSSDQGKEKIKEHIVNKDVDEFGASCIDIYLVAYVAENYGKGRQNFIQYVKEKGISDKENSAKAIWQVGKGDGTYLDVLNDDGTVKDWTFFRKWLGIESEEQQETNVIEEVRKLNELVEKTNEKNEKALKKAVDNLNKLSDKIEEQNNKLERQQKDIIKLSEEIAKLKKEREQSIWEKTKHFFSQ